MAAPQRIKELVENFKANLEHVHSLDYKEEDLRNHFLNPFFQELGWDMEDRAGKGPMRDLYYEKTIKSGAPDYGFYTDGKRRFFVEAKNPSVNICTNQEAALQLRGYGWSAKVPRCILTDFEALSIYDTTVKPKSSDQARVARIGTCIPYTEFVERWDEISAIFSRDAVMAGSLEKLEKKRARQTVDKELLVDISHWRDLLAHNIANRNEVSEERLNRIVQDTISRVLFLRICEDRGIAPEGDLRAVANGDGAYAKLYKLFKKAEQRYDSDLFEVASIADLIIDDKVLKEVISELYFPKSPYKFDAIPAEILGQVYEQFLGKVIRLTQGGQARVEKKPEVRKAGGIYYTPTYIVEYIVSNTLGKLVEGKTPKNIETLSIVDPACGSGSFLLGAYKFLADWYRDWYVSDGAKKHQSAKKIHQDANGQWQLTLEERKRILTAHIYGVDIDRQAVELAKLSLMLEALRAPEQQSLFNDQLLPRMSNNIKWGNALIGTDYFSNRTELEIGERGMINPFDWDGKDGFPGIMNRDGFDIVIGNPPYGAELTQSEQTYLAQTYSVASYQLDTYPLFIEKAISLLKPSQGFFGFIMPSAWVASEYDRKMRLFLLEKTTIEAVVIAPKNVFEDATVETLILIAKKSQGINQKIRVERWDQENQEIYMLKQGDIKNTMDFAFPVYMNPMARSVILRIKTSSQRIGDYAEAVWGVKIYQKGKGTPKQSFREAEQKKFNYNKKEAPTHRPLLGGSEIVRYGLRWKGRYIDYGPWLAEPRTPGWFIGPRILVREVTAEGKIQATYTEEDFVFSNSVDGVRVQNKRIDNKLVLAILNSRLITFYNMLTSANAFKGAFPKVLIKDIENFPVPDLEKTSSSLIEKIIGSVNRILSLTKEDAGLKGDSEQIAIKRQIDAVDRQINQFIYELYGLTDEEVHIVEGSRG